MATHHYAARSNRVFAFLLTGVVTVLETLLVGAAVTFLSGASWGWLSEISGNSKVINPLALPSLAAGAVTTFIQLFRDDFDYNVALGILRPVSMVLMMLLPPRRPVVLPGPPGRRRDAGSAPRPGVGSARSTCA